ncbi:Na+/H+ antiporter subunit E [Herbiconiux sp. KACC 21604]|uniref:Na+/H+ antiporter subunit E n=1 Tax=unclassified Herbiconiux TaxID=2618217 RepID=UPI0014913124|nr:Na+/H+ antiporter subunit E [Herbiconiux sp. SALV-R1]QJU55052.1 Na+/H+ antiporter subunit E [Herbiconiux sp. SALV-R1]WPO86192.1 Na+/H+ antiporter subunit E [Herbiconiux sp. KACC 21604]
MKAVIASGVVPFLGLVLLWMLLWGEFTVINLLIGVLLALVVSITFYLPAVRLSGRLNVLWAAVLFGRLLVDIVVASLQITWVAVNPRYRPSNAIIAVQLRSRSDLVMTFTGEAVSLVPGSLVLDLDRDEGILYLHALNVTSLEQIPKLKREVLATERRIILAGGSRDDLERLRAEEQREAGAGTAAGAAGKEPGS